MLNLLKRREVIRRRDKIDAVQLEMQHLKDVLHTALLERGDLNTVQRMTVLRDLVEEVKGENSIKLMEDAEKMSESEKSNDILQGIMLFNLM